MAISESILPEFDHETATTRALLERVPEGKAGWRPHAKSMSLGELAMHIAHLPQWASVTLERTGFDTNPLEGQRARTPSFESVALLLQAYDNGVKDARAMLARTSDGEFMVSWTLKNAGKAMFSMPRGGVPLVHPEPRRAPQRPAERLPAPPRRPDPEHLRTDGGYWPVAGS